MASAEVVSLPDAGDAASSSVTAVEKKRRVEVENMILVQLSERGMEIWELLTKVRAEGEERVELLKLLFRYVDNVMNDPSNPKFRQINTANRHFIDKIKMVDLATVASLLEIAGFRLDDDRAFYRMREAQSIEELTALSEVWYLTQVATWFLALTRTQLVASKACFTLSDSLGAAMSVFVRDVGTAAFRGHLAEASAAKKIRDKYEYFSSAVRLTPAFFEAHSGVEDMFTSWLCAKWIFETYLKPDIGTVAVTDTATDSALDDAKEEAIDEKKEEDCSASDLRTPIVVLDIGSGWGNIGRCLRSFEGLSDKRKFARLQLHAFDISRGMLEVAKAHGFDVGYASMTEKDCAKERLATVGDLSVDAIVSANCLMQDSAIGHPSHLFLIEAIRVLKVEGAVFAARRKLDVALSEMQVWKEQALKFHLSEVRSGRVRESVFVQWQKILDYSTIS